MRFIILHYHILKNAGTTIENILDRNFGERLARLDTPDRDGRIGQADILSYLDKNPHIEAISSHQIHYPVPTAPGYIFFDLCFLRDPLERLRSTYDYFRQRPADGDPVSDAANNLDFGKFMARLIERFPERVDNPQTNLLANGEADRPTIPEDLDRALERMREVSFLGVVDLFDQSVAAGQRLLQAVFPNLDCVEPPANVSRGLAGTMASRRAQVREACGRAVYAELLRQNALDFQLVRMARAEVRRRFREVGQTIGFRGLSGPRHASAGQATKTDRMPRLLRAAPHIRAVRRLFNADFYARNYSAKHPLLDFLSCGAFEGRRPHPLFDPAFYLRKYPDVAASKTNPLVHYMRRGAAEMRQPHPLFDPSFYLNRYPDVQEAGVNPLLHYIRHGAAERRKPCALFDPAYYLKACPQARDAADPLTHFLEHGAPANPHPLFDCASYLQAHADAAQAGINPLEHYVLRQTEPAHGGAVRFKVLDAEASAILTEHECGRIGVSCEPQQRPFFRALRIDQIRAQVPNSSR
jgi:hypothetical protein